MNISSILCVCTGNICRSPLAERLMAAALPGATVASAGIGALQGKPMDPAAATIAQREGFVADDHRGQQLTAALVKQYELILVMEEDQKRWIEDRFPESRGRVFMFTQWQDGEDIVDPYRLSGEIFESVYEELRSCAEDWQQRLRS